ncbi:ras and Rab interactor 3-like isoform X2 [Protopterus annectens]|uniref:ras and Rab interactor 3-like isoform X2 n=1 Tax=Protopterus annectens TaxID=7888 RepID=UPI001CFA7DD2|nr:ras and Rab interactor 3-like isoform X2 [Protopterus annectens]
MVFNFFKTTLFMRHCYKLHLERVKVLPVVRLENSHLGFVDIFQLIAFYLITRDVLPCCLHLPTVVLELSKREDLERVSELGIQFWTSSFNRKQEYFCHTTRETTASTEQKPDTVGLGSQQMCSIQVTTENGALCFINPLFISVHGDSWLTEVPSSMHSFRNQGNAVKLRNEEGFKSNLLLMKTQVSIDSEPIGWGALDSEEFQQSQNKIEEAFTDINCESPYLIDSADKRRKSWVPLPSGSSSDSMDSEYFDKKLIFQSPSVEVKEEDLKSDGKDIHIVQSPHRASWIEGDQITRPRLLKKSRSEASLFSCESLLLPPISELDSLSISSMEDEGDSLSTLTVATNKKRHSTALTNKVLHRLSAVSNVLTGLISFDRRVNKKILDLIQEQTSYLGGLVQSFISHTLKNSSKYPTSTELLQEIRQMITNLKNYLLEGSELQPVLEHPEAEDYNLDSIIEEALYKGILKPLKNHIYFQLNEFHTKDGTLKKLKDNQKTMKCQSLPGLGVTASVPDAAGLEKIRQKFTLMHSTYSPKKKVMQLLKACKLIYDAMANTSNKPYGADDFLPVLTYVLVQSDIDRLQLDVEYMMELLDPALLHGEGGYYLTTLFGALYHIGNFQPKMITRQISAEAQNSIHQWHRRRTLHHNHSWRRVTQDFLYVSFQEPFSMQKTIPTSKHMTAAEICRTCCEKYEVKNPESYGLFLVRDNEYQLLDDVSCPQKIKADLQKTEGSIINFVYAQKSSSSISRTPSEELLTQL